MTSAFGYNKTCSYNESKCYAWIMFCYRGDVTVASSTIGTRGPLSQDVEVNVVYGLKATDTTTD